MAHLADSNASMVLTPPTDGVLTVVLEGEFDLLSVEALRPTIESALALEASRVVVAELADVASAEAPGLTGNDGAGYLAAWLSGSL